MKTAKSEVSIERFRCKEPGMGKSRRSMKRTQSYRESMGYPNAKTARTAHPLKEQV